MVLATWLAAEAASTAVMVHHLAKRYNSTQPALDEISLTVPRGTGLVLIGPSGSGKSTLLRLIAGLEPPSGGEVWLGGRLATRWPAWQRQIGLVSAGGALYPHWTIEQNLQAALRWQQPVHRGAAERPKTGLRSCSWFGRPLSAVRQRRLANEIERLGLKGLQSLRPAVLSAGERQRVALARAVVSRSRLLLLDEPLAHLDALHRAAWLEWWQTTGRKGNSWIWVTHDQTEALACGDQLGVLQGGKLWQLGTPQEVYERPAWQFVAELLGSPAINRSSATWQIESEKLHGELASGQVLEWCGTWATGWERPPASGPWVLAARPEDLEVLPANGFRPEVQLAQPGGWCTGRIGLPAAGVPRHTVTVELGSNAMCEPVRWLAQASGGADLPVGTPVVCRARRLHGFAASDGQRLTGWSVVRSA